MKKIIAVIPLFLSLNCFSENMDYQILNAGENDMIVNYRICHSETQAFHSDSICFPEKSFILPAKKKPSDKNYYRIEPPEGFKAKFLFFELLDIYEKDEQGNIIAKGKFMEFPHSVSCGFGYFLNDYIKAKTYARVILDDIKGSPHIVCQHAYDLF